MAFPKATGASAAKADRAFRATALQQEGRKGIWEKTCVQ